MAGPSYELIVAAVSGDEQAMEKIIQHYEPMIEEQCGGNEVVRQQIISGLVDAIQHYDLNDLEKNDAYLREKYPESQEA